MTHTVNIRRFEPEMRAYASQIPEIAPKMAKYSWVKTLDGLPTLAKLVIGLIAYPLAYLHDWGNKLRIKEGSFTEAREITLQQLRVDKGSPALPAQRVLDYWDKKEMNYFTSDLLSRSSQLACSFLAKTTSSYRNQLDEDARQFIKNRFPFPCILKNKVVEDGVDPHTQTVIIQYVYDIYYEDTFVGKLTVRSEDHFNEQEKIQGKTSYAINIDHTMAEKALEQYNLNIIDDYLQSTFKPDNYTIKNKTSQVHLRNTILKVKKKYEIYYHEAYIGSVSLNGNYEIKHGKMQGKMKYHYELHPKLKKHKRPKVSL